MDDPIGDGFPMGFVGDIDLVQDSAFVFVADTDNDLTSSETFDPNDEDLLIRIRVSNAVRNTDDRVLTQEVCTATSVESRSRVNASRSAPCEAGGDATASSRIA